MPTSAAGPDARVINLRAMAMCAMTTPPNFFGCPSIPARFTFRNINRLPRDRDRWFESISFQRRVRANLIAPRQAGGASCSEEDFFDRIRQARIMLTISNVDNTLFAFLTGSFLSIGEG